MAKYHASSNRRVPFLPERHIEQEAAVLLAEYGQAHGAVTEPPIPIDDIIELYLELTFEFKDMQALFGVGDVHGALWVNERHVGVDASPSSGAIASRWHTRPAIGGCTDICSRRGPTSFPCCRRMPNGRSTSAAPPIATRLRFRRTSSPPRCLMPREMVKAVWHKWRGQMEPICLPDLESKRRQILTAEVLRRGGLKQSKNAAEDMVLEHLARPLAERFQVSAEAMRIRLENMRLLLRKKETTLFD